MKIRKDANVFFIVIAILALIALIGATYYFQHEFIEINTKYNEARMKIDNLKDELEFNMNRNMRLNETLETIRERYNSQKKEIESAFNILEGEKFNLSQRLNSTEVTLQQTKAELEIKKQEYDNLKIKHDQALFNITKMENIIDTYKGKMDSIRNETVIAQGKINDLLDYVDDLDCNCSLSYVRDNADSSLYHMGQVIDIIG